ncbi:alanine racemase [Sandaracinobacter sp. RS1-74]|uniref:alanine racemase n=1 Tax=Sandaracinobacteroides sayramensis TaxID=2913411 RepID=UPI001EDB4E39|nr:alanine racemase [Sandaracinobacteroides sayramensis]MCG2841760.1 alanine racemase [Sandaracinobacteroides sayramensis]
MEEAALAANFRWFEERAGVPAIPAVKADGYGLGAAQVVERLLKAGARTFAVSSWWEAQALGRPDLPLVVLHGFTPDCAPAAAALPLARPALATVAQCRAWAEAFPGREADLMVNTGMNRLGLEASELGAADGLRLAVLHSHLACADEPAHPHTPAQLAAFRALSGALPGVTRALANSAGICWGREYSFDHVRPGIGLYGGVPHPDARVAQVVRPEARVLQVRDVPEGQTVGYGAVWTARRDSRVAILNAGYADGLPRQLMQRLRVRLGGALLPLAGRISMDMLAVDVTGADVAEGDWLAFDFDLPALTEGTGLAQYELLVWMSRRYDRIWV